MMKTLNDKEWQERKLEELFTVGAGVRLTNANKIDGNRPFIGATDNSNGITGFVKNTNNSLDSNVLGVNYNGAPCIAFYHPYECIFTDDVKRLHLVNCLNDEYKMLFFKGIIAQQRVKYSYGYKFNEKRMLRQKLMVPVTDDGEPDFEYMSDYVREHKEAMLAKYRDYAQKQIAEIGDYVEIPALDDKDWKKFALVDLFSFKLPGGDNQLKTAKVGNIPLVSAGTSNNGFVGFISDGDKGSYFGGNKITIDMFGMAFYQATMFYGVSHGRINILSRNDSCINKFIGLFIVQCINYGTQQKYSYNQMCSQKRLIHQNIMLPINDTGEPDFEYMSQYAKNMMLRKYKQYLMFLKNQTV